MVQPYRILIREKQHALFANDYNSREKGTMSVNSIDMSTLIPGPLTNPRWPVGVNTDPTLS